MVYLIRSCGTFKCCYIYESLENKTKNVLKGGYLDFSHLTELTDIYITEIYKKKKKKIQIINN